MSYYDDRDYKTAPPPRPRYRDAPPDPDSSYAGDSLSRKSTRTSNSTYADDLPPARKVASYDDRGPPPRQRRDDRYGDRERDRDRDRDGGSGGGGRELAVMRPSTTRRRSEEDSYRAYRGQERGQGYGERMNDRDRDRDVTREVVDRRRDDRGGDPNQRGTIVVVGGQPRYRNDNDSRTNLGGSESRRDTPRYLAERPRSAFYRSSRDDEERPRERERERDRDRDRDRGEYDRSGDRRYIEQKSRRDDYDDDKTTRDNAQRGEPEPRRTGRYSPQRVPDAPKIILTSSTPTMRRSPSPTEPRGERDIRRRGRRNRDSAIVDPDDNNNSSNDIRGPSRPKPQRLRSALRGSRAAEYPDDQPESSSNAGAPSDRRTKDGNTTLGRARSVSLRLTALEKQKHDHEAEYGLEWHERPGREAKHAGKWLGHGMDDDLMSETYVARHGREGAGDWGHDGRDDGERRRGGERGGGDRDRDRDRDRGGEKDVDRSADDDGKRRRRRRATNDDDGAVRRRPERSDDGGRDEDEEAVVVDRKKSYRDRDDGDGEVVVVDKRRSERDRGDRDDDGPRTEDRNRDDGSEGEEDDRREKRRRERRRRRDGSRDRGSRD